MAARSLEEIKQDIRSRIGHRAPFLLADRNESEEALANLFGIKMFEELVQVMPALSLKTQGWLDKPCAPLLLINGKEDKQVPLEDFYLLLESGQPKTARLFPGGHMGNSPEIFSTILRWLHRMLDGERG
ncbi:hypothetical protein EPO44_19485 [bacterium]|nr:MAG: hypothetical protein EPO44_19485 [bacterium]